MKANLRDVLSILCIFFSFSLFAQTNYWSKVNQEELSQLEKIDRKSQPDGFTLYQLDLDALKNKLKKAPQHTQQAAPFILEFPMPNGEMEQFSVVEFSIMAPELQTKYPQIRTYKAKGIDDPTASMRFSVTPQGFHAMSLSGKRMAMYIDPYTTDREHYIVFAREALSGQVSDFTCFMDDESLIPTLVRGESQQTMAANDSQLRTYRLALSCTAEYGNIFATSTATAKADIQAQMAVSINRVNEIYERDLAITLQFIPNNDALIYFGSTAADPWSNEFNQTTQNTIDNTIGNANYDIGHNFNTTGGGNAGCIGCVCVSGQKGSAYTGSNNPVGDAFYIDYVAHEMGHQFGGYHTMNICSRSGDGTTEVEPGSGSSIMGYAGICSPNVQNNSDAHFNYVNIRDIADNIKNGPSSSCAQITTLANAAPVADAGIDYTIPKSTAFVLEGSATDVDGTASLTYNWSQNDPEPAPGNGQPQPTWVDGPLYRSILPTSSPKRYMPKLSDVIAGNLTPTWEVTPSVGRELNFAFTVRDNANTFANGIGQTDTDLMKVTVANNAGPFVVTSQNQSGITWNVGSSQTITWDVANTDVAPVSANEVDILLSIDGGQNFSQVIAQNHPNTGNALVTVPNVGDVTNARLMVKASNSIFYAVNTTSFAIQEVDYVLSFNSTFQEVCLPNTANYTFTYNTFNGYSQNTTFSVSNLPTGATATFTPNAASSTGTQVDLALSNLSGVSVGEYTFNVKATSNGVTQEYPLVLGVYDNNSVTPTLLTPAQGAIDVATPSVLTWSNESNASSYQLQIAEDANFTTLVVDESLSDNNYTFAGQNETTYYWRVKAINACAAFSYSAASSFTTEACDICPSSGDSQSPVAITEVNFNTINNTSGKSGGYSDFTSLTTQVDKGQSYTLSVRGDAGGSNFIAGVYAYIDWNQNCVFDANERYDLGGVVGASQSTNSPINITVPNDAVEGSTIMRVSTEFFAYPNDCAVGFTGEVEDYTVVVNTLGLNENDLARQFKVWPNPNEGAFNLQYTGQGSLKVQVYDVAGRLIYRRDFKENPQTGFKVNLPTAQTGVYFLKASTSNNQAINRKIIVR
jgi:hypothetical protein